MLVLVSCPVSFLGYKPSMVPAILWVFSHLAADLFIGATIEVEFLKKLTVTVVAAFHFPANVLRGFLAHFVVEVDDVMNVMHVHDKPPHLLWDFGLRVDYIADDLRHLLPDLR